MIEGLITAVMATISGSDTAKKAGNELAEATWNTIRPYLIEDAESGADAGAKLQQAAGEIRGEAPASPAAEELVRERLRTALTGNPDLIDKLNGLTNQADGPNIIFNKDVRENAKVFNNNTFNSGGGDMNF